MKTIIENYKLKIENGRMEMPEFGIQNKGKRLFFWLLAPGFWLLLFFAIFNSPAFASPTLARLSFWVPPARMSEFEAAYREKVVPILKRHGLTESAERGRATPDSIFSRLFELKTPLEVEEKQKALQGDPAWTAMLQAMGVSFGMSQPDGLMRFAFRLYAAPAGHGKVVSAGPGKAVPAGRGTGHWRTYDVTDGLPVGNVRPILQDREGNLWFGTWGGGVSRYDGQKFTTFTTKDGLAGNYVFSSLRDREGVLWFGTAGDGVSRYDGQRFTTFAIKDGLPVNNVYSIFQDREGVLWFGRQGGVSRYDGQKFTTFTTKDGLAGNNVYSIFQDREGVLWFGGEGGMSRYDGQKFTTFTIKDGPADDRVTSVLQDREGYLWFGTKSGGVSRYDGQKFTTFTTKDGLAGKTVYPIFQDREGNLWFGAWGGGVSRYDPSANSGQAPSASSGQKFITFSAEDGLADNTVWSIFQDQEGHLWFGTGRGVSRYDGYVFTTFTPKDGLANKNMQSIFQDREGHLWFSTPNGVIRYDGVTFTTFTAEDGLPSDVRSVFQDREGNLWFATPNGISRYDGVTFTTFTAEDGLPSDDVWSVFQDREGNLWFGGSDANGVCRYDGVTFNVFNTEDGLAATWVLSIFQDRDGNLWFGTSRGVSRYDGKTFTTVITKEWLAHNRVRSIFQDREGNLWFGTDGGVSRYDGKTFTAFTTEDGLAGNVVGSILQDREGNLWFGSGGGVSRYDGQVFQTMTRQDGLAGNGVASILQDRGGNLWFGGQDGVTRYRKPAPSPPPVYVDAVTADRRYEKTSALAIPSSVNLTVFEFHAISFKTRPEAMVYRYRLKGYDKDWKNTHARRVEYQNLPRGSYTFEVQAVDRDLVYSEKPATVALRVHAPYTLIGLWSALSVALALVAWQTARVIRRDRRLQEANAALSSANKDLFGLNQELQASNQQLAEANRHIQEATQRKSAFLASMSHELRTPMNAIMGFTNLVLRRSGDALPERQRENLVKVKQASEHLLSLINDILDLSKVEAGKIEVKPVQFGVRDLIASCCETVGPLARAGVTLHHEVSEDVGEAHTDEARLRQIVINLLSNALKFTEKGEVRVSVKAPTPTLPVNGEGASVPPSTGGPQGGQHSGRDRFLEIAVSDTGVGIPADSLGLIFEEFRQVEGSHQQQKGTGLGLSITKKLTELLGGTIGVESEVGKGSTFTVRVPVVYRERQGG